MDKNPTIVFTRPGEVIIENQEIPSPQEGQLLIKTVKTLISTGTELTILKSKNIPEGSAWAQYGKFPFEPGYNNIGVVVETGKGVEKDWIGKKVATHCRHSQYVISYPSHSQLIQRDIKDEYAVFFSLAEIVMNGVRRGNVRWGESIVIYGAGVLGQMAVRFCRMCGAKPVISVDISDYRLNRLPHDVSIITANPEKCDLVSIVKEATKGRMADAVYEVTGNAELIPEEFKVLRIQGRFVILSSPSGKTSSFDFHDLCNGPSFTIIGTHTGSHPSHETLDNPWTNKRNAEFFFDMVADGEIDMEELISHRSHYSEAINIYNMLLKDRSMTMGIVLDWA